MPAVVSTRLKLFARETAGPPKSGRIKKTFPTARTGRAQRIIALYKSATPKNDDPMAASGYQFSAKILSAVSHTPFTYVMATQIVEGVFGPERNAPVPDYLAEAYTAADSKISKPASAHMGACLNAISQEALGL
jgi:hypothetical protein